MSIKSLTRGEYEARVLQGKMLVLLDFSAEWCAPCRMLAPTLHEIAAERSDLTVYQIDVDKEPELAQTFQITSLPTLVVLRSGAVKKVSTGVQDKEAVLSMLD